LTGIVQSLGTIQTALDINHKETKKLLYNFSEETKWHLNEQDKQAETYNALLNTKLKSIVKQNELLRKEAKTNKIIQIVGLTIVLIILIYIAVT
jgi:serine/threonine protein phosphatase PrpC